MNLKLATYSLEIHGADPHTDQTLQAILLRAEFLSISFRLKMTR